MGRPGSRRRVVMVAHNLYDAKAAVAHSRHLPWLAPQTAPGARARATLVQGESSWTRGERAYGVCGRVPGSTGGQNCPRAGRTYGYTGGKVRCRRVEYRPAWPSWPAARGAGPRGGQAVGGRRGWAGGVLRHEI